MTGRPQAVAMMRFKSMRGFLFVAAATLLVVAGTPEQGLAGAPPIAWTGGGTVGVAGTAVSPDGQLLATAAGDNTVKLWRVSDGALLRTLAGHDGTVSSVAFSPDGTMVVSGGEYVFGSPNGNVKLWRVADGRLLGDLVAPSGTNAYTVRFSPNGSLVAAGHQGGQVNIWRTADRALVRTLVGDPGGLPQVLSIAFSPDGALLAAGNGSNTVRVFRVANGTLVRTLSGHSFFVAAVAFSPDGTMLASGSWDQTVRLWRVGTYALIRTLRVPEAVYAVGFSADNQALAAGNGDAVQLWRPSTGAALRTIKAPAVSSLAFVGAVTIAIGGFDGHVRTWRVADGALLRTFGRHTGPVYTVSFSPDGTLLGSAGADTTARLWRAATGADAQELIGHTDAVNAVAFAPNNSDVATPAGSPPPDTTDRSIKLWRVGTAAARLTLAGHVGGSTGAAFTVDGQTLISSGRDNALRFWRVSDGVAIKAVTTGSPHGALAMSPNRKLVATEGAGTSVNLYDADGTFRRTIALAAAPTSLSFSGDGALLAVGLEAYGNNVRVFRTDTGAPVVTLPGDPDGFVQGVAFAPTGTVLAAGSGFSHVVQLWDTAGGGRLLASYDQETGWGPFPQLPLAFAPGGGLLAYGRGDATVISAELSPVGSRVTRPSRNVRGI